MFFRRVATLALVLVHGLTLGSLMAEAPYKHEGKIGELVQPLIDAGVLHGVSVGIVDRDRHWVHSYGSLSSENPIQPTEKTIYEIGSISKVFTGILLANAVNAGEASLDDAVGSIATPVVEKNSEVCNSIRLRHLSTHSSGLPRMPGNWSPADPNQPYADYDRSMMLEFLGSVRPSQPPGAPSGYSNFAVGLLGELLSMKTNLTYEQLLNQRITGPLGMLDTSLRVNDGNRSRVAPPHNASGAADYEWKFDAFAGAGGIHSTTNDMLRFIDAHLNPVTDESQMELGAAIELAWKQQLPASGGAFAMGLGWLIARDGETRWHNGQTGGYHSMLMINRQVDAGVIVLSNSANADVDGIGESIIQLLAGMNVEPVKIPDAKVAAEDVKRLVGSYELVPEFILTVTADGEKLFVQATNQAQLRVYPESLTKWSYREVDAQLTFELPESGSAPSVTLHQNGQNMKAIRK